MRYPGNVRFAKISRVTVVADGVVKLSRFPSLVNAYLVDDVLVDAGTAGGSARLLATLCGREVSAHVVTHAHPDHFGASHAVCEELGLPLWVGAADAEAVETGTPVLPSSPASGVLARSPRPAPHPVARRLTEGDQVGSFTVLEVPGHTPGHVALWREADRTLLCGDVFFRVPRLSAPWRILTADPVLNQRSMARLAALRPDLTLFGHGAPLRDPERLAKVAAPGDFRARS